MTAGTPAEAPADASAETGPATDPEQHDGVGTLRARRFWSARRNVAALAALVLGGAAGALLYEEIYIQSGHRAHAWRLRVSDDLAHRHLDDHWVIAASAVACALGLWLLVLAATPGLRRLLPLAAVGTTGVRAALERRAAAAMLQRAAMEAPGVHDARATVGRRKAKVQAVVGFGDREEVRALLTELLARERKALGLVRPPMINVKIRGRSR